MLSISPRDSTGTIAHAAVIRQCMQYDRSVGNGLIPTVQLNNNVT